MRVDMCDHAPEYCVVYAILMEFWQQETEIGKEKVKPNNSFKLKAKNDDEDIQLKATRKRE